MPSPQNPSYSSQAEPSAPLSAGVGHYENFPVASWLCPAALRPAVMAIYHFARCADDIADEGDATAPQRLDELAAYRQSLQSALDGTGATDARWSSIFEPLAVAARRHALPPALLHDLLSAFEQDVQHTASGHVYATEAELLAYCRLSANPVGRLLLHLYGVHDTDSLRRSDAVCSALQLINFWQDLGEDLARARHYLPSDTLAAHGLQRTDFLNPGLQGEPREPAMQAVVAGLCASARRRMLDGAPLALALPGRAGWELRLVVQGGLRILDRIEAIGHRSWAERVTLGRSDLPQLLWRAARMRG